MKYLWTDPDNIKKTALLIYIQAVVTWLNMPMKDAKKRGVQVCPDSEEVNSYIMDTYSIESTHGRYVYKYKHDRYIKLNLCNQIYIIYRLRPNSIKDKGVIHCMILALIIYNFELDIELFATIFSHRMGVKKLTSLARIIGALPNKEDKKIISLKVPLPPPPSIVKKGKKK